MIEYSFAEHPEALAIGIFIIMFAVLSYLLSKMNIGKMPAAISALSISLIGSWYLYNERFFGLEGILAFVIYLAVAALFLRILWAFFKFLKSSFGRP